MSLTLGCDLGQVRRAGVAELEDLAIELRAKILAVCGKNGGHLGSSLGAVELILALHQVFNSPQDQIIFDVGHQAYAHKILTGRVREFNCLRREGGLSGFTDPQESVHDANVAGHAGNSISFALGAALAESNKRPKVVVIGDGSLGNGQAFEALNQLAASEANVLVIVNHNGLAIDPCVGALSKQSSYQDFFESFGLPFVGPVSGHNLNQLLAVLRELKDFSRPRVLQVETCKGQGIAWAQRAPDGAHFYCQTGSSGQKLQVVVGQILERLGQRDKRVVLVTPAMTQGGGLAAFAQKFPERFFDVGIAEGHSITLAAGLASRGRRVLVHVYASFLQRGFDQVIHDVALSGLPVTFLVDRAGLVGEDGATHQGTLAPNFLSLIPKLSVLLPGDVPELQAAIEQSSTCRQPRAILYPKVCLDSETTLLPFGRSTIGNGFVRRRPGARLNLLTTGWLKQVGVGLPLRLPVNHYHCADWQVTASELKALASDKLPLWVAEENVAAGGLAQRLALALMNKIPALESLSIPGEFTAQATREQQLQRYGLGWAQMIKKISAYVNV